ncbi:MAG: hypothetical protein ACK502_00755 [Alphaproteobacteria bacterium]
MNISELDIEIDRLQSRLDPDSKTYRYESVQLDILVMKRDLLELTKAKQTAESEISAMRKQLDYHELRTRVLETAFVALCAPGMREALVIKTCEKLAEKIQGKPL